MPSINKIFLLGPLTRDPLLRQTSRGTLFCTFDLQLDPTERGGPCIMRVIIFGKQAEPAARHLGRGSTVLVTGHLRRRERVTQAGQKLRSLEIVAERVEFLSAPANRAVELARTLIDAPVVVPEADAPAQVDKSDPPARDAR